MASGSELLRVSNPTTYTGTGTTSVSQIQHTIEQRWKRMPEKVRHLLVESDEPVDLHALAKFWSQPWESELILTNSHSLDSRSWSLALAYLKLGKMKEARALALNGSFIRQCSDIPIWRIFKLFEKKGADVSTGGFKLPAFSKLLPIFTQAFHSCQTPQTTEAFCHEQLSAQRKGVNMIIDKHVMQFIDQIGDDWDSRGSSTSNRRTPSPKTASTETQIQLILVCDANADERHTLSIGSSTTLKTLFKDYAEERGASLRSLRFSYRGKTLFLSSAGNKTPEQLRMRHRDVITVHGTSTAREIGSDGDASKQKSKTALKKATSTKNQTKTSKGKGKKKKEIQQEEPVETLQEWKAQHSTKLSKLHEEVHHHLTEIRRRLNGLDLKCQLPKKKRKNGRNTKAQYNVDENQILTDFGIGGKAGKSCFSVQVGEVQHLYKTTKKPSRKTSRSGATALLDLHGCTRGEALRQLDERLPVWVDAAMRGSYPFVIPATIVCGGGGQILSQAVEQWIRENAQVANAMKNVSQ